MANDPGRELVDRFFAGQEAFQRMQQAMARLVLPPEQRHALTDAFAGLMTPGAQLDTMIELTEAFGPPQAQIEAIAEQLVAQRAQLQEMTQNLDRFEATVNRLAAAAEQLAAGQQLFVQLARTVSGQSPGRKASGAQPGGSADPPTEPDDRPGSD